MNDVHRTHASTKLYWGLKRRYEHWARDNQVYFITATVRDHRHAFAESEARAVFWDRFAHHTSSNTFTPWVTSLLSNHYHTLGFLRDGSRLGTMVRGIHGSTAKLVNDLLPERISPFWRDQSGQDYFDACIRDPEDCRNAYAYVLNQSVRHGLATDPALYHDTHVMIEVERGIARACELDAFLVGGRNRKSPR